MHTVCQTLGSKLYRESCVLPWSMTLDYSSGKPCYPHSSFLTKPILNYKLRERDGEKKEVVEREKRKNGGRNRKRVRRRSRRKGGKGRIERGKKREEKAREEEQKKVVGREENGEKEEREGGNENPLRLKKKPQVK